MLVQERFELRITPAALETSVPKISFLLKNASGVPIKYPVLHALV